MGCIEVGFSKDEHAKLSGFTLSGIAMPYYNWFDFLGVMIVILLLVAHAA